MNNIVYAKYENSDCDGLTKHFEIFLPDNKCVFGEKTLCGGDVLVLPPLTRFTFKGFSGIHIITEQAVLPFKKPAVIKDDKNCGVKNCAEQILFYKDGSHLVLSALGDLFSALISAFSDKDGISPASKHIMTAIGKGVSDCMFSLDDCIKKLPLNYDYVRKNFKREIGITPREYLLKERMKLAAGLISSGVSNKYSLYTVSQIAEACGFSDPLYFSRVFKKYYGVSPSEYGRD